MPNVLNPQHRHFLECAWEALEPMFAVIRAPLVPKGQAVCAS